MRCQVLRLVCGFSELSGGLRNPSIFSAGSPTQETFFRAFSDQSVTQESFKSQKKAEGFSRFKLAQEVVQALEALGISEPTQIQKKVIPIALKSQSAFISAETGTGKTAAYALPLLELTRRQLALEAESSRKKTEDGAKEGEGTSESAMGDLAFKEKAKRDAQPISGRFQRPFCLVLTPTADLASQVFGQFQKLGRFLPDIRVDLLTAATSVEPEKQVRALHRKDAEVLVATPGRLLNLLKMALDQRKLQGAPSEPANVPTFERPLSLMGVRHWVIDECDRMAKMGLMQDVKQLFPFLPRPPEDPQEKPMQVLLVSATVTKEAAFLLRRFAPNAASIDLNPEHQVAQTVKHVAYTVTSRRKASLLEYLLKRKGSFRDAQVLVFTRTRQRAVRLGEVLARKGLSAEAVHSDLTGTQRWKILEGFKARKFQCLVATDVLGRGIDILDLPFVVNFDLPLSPEEYIHHVGRTGRAGRPGMAVSFVSKDSQEVNIGGPHQTAVLWEEDFLAQVEQLIGGKVERRKVPGPWKDVDWHELDEALGEGANSRFPNEKKSDGKSGGLQSKISLGAGSRITNRSERRVGRDEASELQSASDGPIKVQDVVEGMEKGLAVRAGIKRLTDVEKEREARATKHAKRRMNMKTRKAAMQGT